MEKSSRIIGRVITITGALFLSFTPGLRADEASHTKAAEDLLVAAQMEDAFTKTIDSALDAQVAQNPQLASVKPIMKAFFVKYMSWDALKGDLTKLYADAFTEEDLKAITAFYKTPSGKKMAKVTPELMAKGAALGQKRVGDHISELQQMIQEDMAKKAGK